MDRRRLYRKGWSVGVLGCFVIGLAVLATARPASAEDSLIAQLEKEYIGIAERARPAVVEITAEGPRVARSEALPPDMPIPPEFRDWFDNPRFRMPRPATSSGSGFVIDQHGWILTNSHVVRGAQKIMVKDVAGNEYEAEQHFIDPLTDVAVLRVKADHDLTSLPLGDSSGIPVGSIVVAIGNPFGEGVSFTTGVVSQVGGEIASPQTDEEGRSVRTITGLIQTDAAINPGNSGGPLLNIRGEAIGITTAIVSRSGGNEGVAFAIPINTAKRIAKQLMDSGKVSRGWIGVGLSDKPVSELKALGAPDGGALVSEVRPDGPASKADLKGGDIVVGIDATPDGVQNPVPVHGPQDVIDVVEVTSPGTEVVLDLVRMGKPLQTTLKLGEIPATLSGSATTALQELPESPLGVTVAALGDDMVKELKLEGKEGVVVTDITETSPALGKLMPGDVIVGANGKPVASVDDYNAAVKDLKSGDTVVFLVKRKDGNTVITTTAAVELEAEG